MSSFRVARSAETRLSHRPMTGCAAGLTWASGGFVVGLAVVLILMSGIQGRPWAIWANLGIQLVVIAGALVHGAIGFIGVIFAVVWLLIVYLRREVKRRQDRGLLPGQQPPSE